MINSRLTIYDILKPIIEGLIFEFKADQIIDLGGGLYKLTACNTYHLTECKVITIDGEDYEIKEVKVNEYIIIKGAVTPGVNIFNIEAPKFFAGTIIATNEELTNIQFSEDKTPFVYLLETVREKFTNDEEAAIEREANLKLCFLTSANFEDWNTQSHREKAIKPMRNLAFELYKNEIFKEFELIDRAKFGVYMSEKGTKTALFNDNLSGVESNVNIEVLKSFICKCEL